MATAVVTLPDGRKVRISGPTKEAVLEQARRLANPGQVSVSAPQIDPDLAIIDRLMSGGGTPGSGPLSESRAPVTLPFGLGEFSVGGLPGRASVALQSVSNETSMPILGATLASAAFPPAAGLAWGSRLPLVGRLTAQFAQRALLPAARAGLGGAAGGAAAESENPGATASSMGSAALGAGGEMALAELGGIGLGKLASKVFAPGLEFLDPLRGVREKLLSRALVVLKDGRKVIDGVKLSRAWRGVPESTKVLMPTVVRESLDSLTPLAAKLKRVGKFAATPAGGEVVEALVVPVATALFGAGVGVPLMVGKALLSPGPAASYLARTELPSEVTRLFLGQATKLGTRTAVSNAE